ncbi:hypothetical protein E1B28_006245 [Marasmius oreades]|uniref:Uncharacterized protein n=1 Tax=Marasmius oreades TaxID=181124 RepID=A0A9P7UW31_9AGAR|nr:uncharacterized protein E1B28_006245 [Marasmius oreades]KAG7095506.1 hypothetical protein E1B28_006245 [Marasmius oreades]
MLKLRLAIVLYTFVLEALFPFPSLPVSESIQKSLIWQTSFFTLWNGYFYIIYFIAFLYFFSIFFVIRQAILNRMKRNSDFRQKVEERKAVYEVKRAAKAAEDRAKGKIPQSPRRVWAKIVINLALSVIMTVNCAVWNRYTDAPTVLDGSLRRFYEMFRLSSRIFVLEMVVLSLLLPVIFGIKVLRARRAARRNAAAGSVQTTEILADGRAPMNEKVLIDLSDGLDYISEKMDLNQTPYKDEEAELREPLL